MTLLRRLARSLFSKGNTATNIILIGIDYPSFSLGKTINDKVHELHISAFIDDEPWTNKTQLHNATVYYPSDLLALIQKHQVELVVQIRHQKPALHETLLAKLADAGCELLTLEDTASVEEQISAILRKLAEIKSTNCKA